MEFVPRPEDEEEIEESYSLLINLSNHPLSTWTEKQLATANEMFDELVDLPFPEIDPEWEHPELIEAVSLCMEKIIDIYNTTVDEQEMEVDMTVHVMGEMSFTYNIINELQSQGIHALCSTTRRISEDLGDGKKVSKFEFVKFRYYNDPRIEQYLATPEGMNSFMEHMSGMFGDFLEQRNNAMMELNGVEEEDDDFGDNYFYDQEDDDLPPHK